MRTPTHAPGILALVTNAITATENIGREVELIRTVTPGEHIPELDKKVSPKVKAPGPYWLVTAPKLRTAYITKGFDKLGPYSNFAIVFQRFLLPLGPRTPSRVKRQASTRPKEKTT